MAAAIIGLIGSVTVTMAPSAARASTGGPLTCTSAASVTTVATTGGLYKWTMLGVGSCLGQQTTDVLSYTGTGSSLGLGGCTQSTVANLDIVVHLVLTSTTNGHTTAVTEHFGAANTTYPVTTPFEVSDSGGTPVGTGTILTHIFAKCPPNGTASASINWVQSL